jgi:hypothetical protein
MLLAQHTKGMKKRQGACSGWSGIDLTPVSLRSTSPSPLAERGSGGEVAHGEDRTINQGGSSFFRGDAEDTEENYEDSLLFSALSVCLR